jgi:hypothetical protein
MIRQDILAVSTNETIMWFFAPSPAGLAALTKAAQKALPENALERTPVIFSKISTTVHTLMAGKESGAKLLRALYGKSYKDINVHFVDYMPLEAVALNAEQMKLRCDSDAHGARMAAYFLPLFDAAIEARDKAQITELFNQFPPSVEKSFIVDRLRYGTKEKNHEDAFPELNDKANPVTLQDWHKEPKA